jgi:hypothetical protein
MSDDARLAMVAQMRREAEETVARIDAKLSGQDADGLVRKEWRAPAHEEPLPPFVPTDPMDELRAFAAERAAGRAAAKAELRAEETRIAEMYSNASTLAQVDERISAAIEAHSRDMAESVGESLGSALAGIDRNLADLRREMRAELAEQLAGLKGEAKARLDRLEPQAATTERELNRRTGRLDDRVGELEDKMQRALHDLQGISAVTEKICRIMGWQ